MNYSISFLQEDPDHIQKKLRDSCPFIAKLVDEIGPMQIELKEDVFAVLADAINSQQLSTKAAAAIHRRFTDRLGGIVDPQGVMLLSDEEFQACGVSRQKRGYMRSLAENFLETPEDYAELHSFSDDIVIERLTRIKGIGVWTAQMFLIFSLGRPDVFPILDLGVRNAMVKLFENPDMSRDEMEERALKWSPYRSVASLYLWRSLK